MKTDLIKQIFTYSTFFIFFTPIQSQAQVIPDNTLPNNSTIKLEQNRFIIENGTRKGNNLFHSFEQFSPHDFEALFNNNIEIKNIFSRITGNSSSMINNSLQTNGNANLFLINPNGIIFGPNATLDIGGSFVGTTANFIRFADGFLYSASPTDESILTISVPMGLGFNSHNSSIVVNGNGHNFVTDSLFSPVYRGPIQTQLKVNSGQNLALIGNNIILNGGNLISNGGRIEVGSVTYGEVRFNSQLTNWIFDYQKVSEFGQIELSLRSSVDASGIGGGSINIQGKNLSMQDGSVILIQNQGSTPSGDLTVNISDSIKLSGTDPIARMPGSIRTETVRLGKGGNIYIKTKNLITQEGGQISSLSFSSANAGDISVNAWENIEILDVSPRQANTFSVITSVAFADGDGGNIFITGQNFLARNGGGLNATTFNRGNAGNVDLNISDLIEVKGFEPTLLTPAQLVSISFGKGNTGNISINSSRLIVNNGGRVGTSSISSGDAGNVTINVSNLIDISGTVPNSLNPSLIISGANIIDPILQELFQAPEVPSGASGNITINTSHLKVTDGALINARNDGTGDGGDISINSEQILLTNSGGITAQSTSGIGGNISIKTKDLQMNNQGIISATAGGQGDGGNILINSDSLLMKDQSQITADAFQGRGGNILINTEVFLVSNDSVITATSELGIDGVVEINTPENNLESVIVPIKAQILELDPNAVQRCLNKEGEKELLLLKPRDAIRSYDNPELIEEPSLELLDISENMSEKQKKFYHQHLPPNALIKSEEGIFAVNLCLKNLLTE